MTKPTRKRTARRPLRRSLSRQPSTARALIYSAAAVAALALIVRATSSPHA